MQSPRLRPLCLVTCLLLASTHCTPAQSSGSPRRLPPGFPALPILPQSVRGPGDVTYTDSLLNVFTRTYAPTMTGGLAFLSPAGSDPTGTLNDPTHPFQTLAWPLRKTTAQVLVLLPGDYDPSDFNIADTGGSTPKAVVCLYPGACKIRVLGGDDLSANTWTPVPNADTGVQTGVYATQIASATPVASAGPKTGAPQRILRTDLVDPQGFPARLALLPSLAALQAARFGWFYDPSSHTLYAALGGRNVNDNRWRLRALYFTPAGNAHLWLTGVTVLFEGIQFEGLSFDAIETQFQGVWVSTNLWISDFVQSFGTEYGFWDIGSTIYAENGLVHANKVDGFNGNWSRAGLAGNPDVMLEANIHSSDAGDISTYGFSGPTLDNGSSSHTGFLASFGSVYERDWGPELADTSSQDIPIPSVSWLVGSIARNSNPSDTDNYGGFQFQGMLSNPIPGDPRNRVAWMDTCQTIGERGYGLVTEYYAVVHLYNSPLRLGGTNSLPPVPYQPDNPK